MKKIAVAVSCVFLLAAATPAGAKPESKDLARARAATARFHDVEVAIAAGYEVLSPCVSSPSGGMGYHYGNFSLMDATLDPANPEVLLYEPTSDGLKLVAVEYFIPEAATTSTPTLFGTTFNGPMDGHAPGMPRHYDLHAWVWRNNPTGIFSDWNPKVSCP